MNKLSKTLSVFISVIMMILSFGSVAVFAENEVPVTVCIDTSANVRAGESFKVDAQLDFNNEDISAAEGICVFRFGLKYNSECLEMLDPNTMLPITLDENKETVNGNIYNCGEIVSESSLDVNMENENTFVLLYGGRKAESDIFNSGTVAEFAFRVKPDVKIDRVAGVGFEIINPEIYVNNKDYKVDAQKKDCYIKIEPAFSITDIGNYWIGKRLCVIGRFSYAPSDDEVLNIKIAPADNTENIIDETSANIMGKAYEAEFDLTKDKYTSGRYMLIMTFENSTLNKEFDIFSETSDSVTPADPTDSDDGKKEDDPKDNDNNTGGGTNTGGNKNNGTSNTGSTTTSTKPSASTDSGNKPQTAVKYPSDLSGHWAETNVKYVYDKALMNGYGDGTFKPEASITRAEFSAVMARLLKLSGKDSAAEKFGDVKGHWAIGYIGALADKGIVGGVTENSFAPDDNITREQMAAILSRAFDLKETSSELFADNDEISDWAHDYVYACRKAGYMTGDAANKFSPLNNASRAEVATVIYRLHSAK